MIMDDILLLSFYENGVMGSRLISYIICYIFLSGKEISRCLFGWFTMLGCEFYKVGLLLFQSI